MAIPYTDRYAVPFPESTFGSRFGVKDQWHPTPHRGTDFKVPVGSRVASVATGQVVSVAKSSILGNVVIVATQLHRRDERGRQRVLYVGYCHLSKPVAKLGQKVKRGDIVALSGDTGSACFGAHLHMTMSYDINGVYRGDVFDPLHFIAVFDDDKSTHW